MKAVILAGGLGTRISEETSSRPKPMIEIGGRPILWHIMKTYSAHGINEFVLCCGYKGYVIKEYFANYFLHMSDVTFDMPHNKMEVHQRNAEPWRVTLVDTGDNTMTGGRLKRVFDYVKDEKEFCFTYGDGVSDVDVGALIAFHRQHGKLATVTAVQPPGRFGVLDMHGNAVHSFIEKPKGADSKSRIMEPIWRRMLRRMKSNSFREALPGVVHTGSEDGENIVAQIMIIILVIGPKKSFWIGRKRIQF